MLNSRFKIIYGVWLIVVLSSTLYSQTIIRVNCGGGTYWDHSGHEWYADQEYTPGSWGHEMGGYALFYDYPISGTSDEPLYQAERNALHWYHFTVPNGTYVVKLKFAELYYDNEGERIFHVEIEGDRVLDNFDILAEVGFAAALDKTFQIDVNDGVLDVHFITIEKEPGVTYAHANIKAIGVEEQGTHEPKLWIDKHELNYYDFSTKKDFEIKNGGELVLEWNCFEDPDETWITNVTPTSGALYQGQTQRIEVYVDRSGLDEGKYKGKISINSNGGDDSVLVYLKVESDVPISEIYPTALDYGSILTKRTFKIENVGTAPLDWTAENENNESWIVEISPTNGTLSPGHRQEIHVSIDRTGMTDSTYQGIIAVETNDGDKDIKINFDTIHKPLNINCGGSLFEDDSAQNWLYDLGFVDGQSIDSDQDIQNTENDPLYQTARSGMTKYQFSVQKNGYYQIDLHFAEIQHEAAGERIFDVHIEDSLVLKDFDIFAECGGFVAAIRSANIDIEDNQLDISFLAKTGEPCIAAIKVNEIPLLHTQSTSLNYGSILNKRTFSFTNVGILELIWSAKDQNNESWLVEISPTDGVLAPFDTQLVTVSIDRSELSDSAYQGNITVETDGGNQGISLMVETKNKPLRINCGGSEYAGENEYLWFEDMLFIDGYLKSCQDSIANTVDDLLYQTVRAGMTKYEFPVQNNGLYKITLHFAEFDYHAIGNRIFDVQVEDSLVLTDFDIFAESGSNFAVIKSANIEITDNQVDISFIPQTGEPCIAAIEIFQCPVMAIEPISLNFGSILTRRMFTILNTGNVELNWSAKNLNNDPWLKEISPASGILTPADTQLVHITIDRSELADSAVFNGTIVVETDGGNQDISLVVETTREPLRINCGGSDYVDNNANLWFDDGFFKGGEMYSYEDSVANTIDDRLYQTVRSGMTEYEFPVQNNGLYAITLHFAEFEYNAAEQRIFDVLIEDSLVLEDFDIFAIHGNFSAARQNIDVKVKDKQLDIIFAAKAGEPCISAIEFNQKQLPTSVAKQADGRPLPDCFQLKQNYPNPFNMETSIYYQLPVASHVTLEIYNLLGQKQKTLMEKEVTAGYHSITWDGRDMSGNAVSSGLYFYRINILPKHDQYIPFTDVRKMLLIK